MTENHAQAENAAISSRPASTCCCHRKETPRSEDNRYCADVLTQLAAAESAVHSISAVVLRNHLETCVVEQIERGNVEIIDEVMNLLKKFSR